MPTPSPRSEFVLESKASARFPDYADGKQFAGFEVVIHRGEQEVFRETFKPGFCNEHFGADDWDLERLFIDSSAMYLGLARFKCDEWEVIIE